MFDSERTGQVWIRTVRQFLEPAADKGWTIPPRGPPVEGSSRVHWDSDGHRAAEEGEKGLTETPAGADTQSCLEGSEGNCNRTLGAALSRQMSKAAARDSVHKECN